MWRDDLRHLLLASEVPASFWRRTEGRERMTADFLAGAATCSIVPPPDIVNNALHSCMTVRFDERGSPLRVKALAMEFGGRDFLIVALDSVGVPTAHAARMRQAISDGTGLRPEDIVLTASHSHSTPFMEPLAGPHPRWPRRSSWQ